MADEPKATWAGRIPGGLAPETWRFLHSLPSDRHLWSDDVRGTLAHVRALEAAEVLTSDEAKQLVDELERIVDEPGLIDEADEDVHSAIERVLTERLGDVGAKVHAGRSRNDQVATALRLWARREVLDAWDAVRGLVAVLAERAVEATDVLVPGYTHLQRAQPVTLGHWLCAHAWAFARDLDRFRAAYRAADVSPLGAGALATSTLGIDPTISAETMGFSSVFDNSMDAVSDRDFLCDAAYAGSMAAVHLSRLAEEIVLWSSSEFGFVDLPDAHATGSSMMPQKKNPDVAELARGAAGPAVGSLTALLVTLKGLPLAYDRDLQADKTAVGETLGRTTAAFRATGGLVAFVEFRTDRMAQAAADPALGATDLAEELVRRGVPFRRAHELVGGVVREATEQGLSLRDVLAGVVDPIGPLDPRDAERLLDPEESVRRRTTSGGPSQGSVAEQIGRLQGIVRRNADELAELRARIEG